MVTADLSVAQVLRSIQDFFQNGKFFPVYCCNGNELWMFYHFFVKATLDYPAFLMFFFFQLFERETKREKIIESRNREFKLKEKQEIEKSSKVVPQDAGKTNHSNLPLKFAT